MKQYFIFIFFTLATFISCSYYDMGAFKITTENAPAVVLTKASGYYYSFSSHWDFGAAATPSASVTAAVSFVHDSSVNPPATTTTVTTPGTDDYIKYLEIVNFTGIVTRTYKNGPFVIFNVTTGVTCTFGIPAAFNYDVRFFCNDTDAKAFYDLMESGGAGKNYWVNSANVSVSVPAASAITTGAGLLTLEDVIIGNIVSCT